MQRYEATMSYYDQIAKNWHKATGYQGGSFKKHVLNDVLLQKMTAVSGKAILELGAGNGYFMKFALQNSAGQNPERVVISDMSSKLLSIAESNFNIADAEYLELDVRGPFPFDDESFDLILATMVFNEVSSRGMKRALGECHRVLGPDGLLLITVTHPTFIEGLNRRDQLKKNKDGILTMPGAKQLRLPIVPRKLKDYERLLAKTAFNWEASDVYGTEKLLSQKPGLRNVGNKPLALVLECRKL
jgi:ubiquinone/menaquinone biosynthesis C-methylase UbiE